MSKIAIDVSPLSDGNAVRGVGYYTSRLVQSLQEVIATEPEFSNIHIDLVSDKRQLATGKYDLIHYPFFDPFKLTLPWNPPAPFLITIHDLVPLQYPANFPAGIKGRLKWQIQKFLAKRARYLLTVSHHSKYVITDILGYNPERIYPTYLAADDNFKPETSTKLLDTIRRKYNLPDKFVLYLGDINWNKNVPKLVEACLANNYPLVIAGSAATKEAPVHPWTVDIHWLQAKYQELGGKGNSKLILAGFVPDEDLPYFFNLATLYCQPSIAEGFGLPITQAMQSGCPVACADSGAMAEILDYNGLMFDPTSVTSIQKALKQYWDNPDLRQEYTKKGLTRSEFFKWEFTARQTLAVYQLALLNEKH